MSQNNKERRTSNSLNIENKCVQVSGEQDSESGSEGTASPGSKVQTHKEPFDKRWKRKSKSRTTGRSRDKRQRGSDIPSSPERVEDEGEDRCATALLRSLQMQGLTPLQVGKLAAEMQVLGLGCCYWQQVPAKSTTGQGSRPPSRFRK
eukprot:4309190-Amphidinium_carterae.1